MSAACSRATSHTHPAPLLLRARMPMPKPAALSLPCVLFCAQLEAAIELIDGSGSGPAAWPSETVLSDIDARLRMLQVWGCAYGFSGFGVVWCGTHPWVLLFFQRCRLASLLQQGWGVHTILCVLLKVHTRLPLCP